MHKKKQIGLKDMVNNITVSWTWCAILSSTPMVVVSRIVIIALLLLLMTNIVVTILELEK